MTLRPVTSMQPFIDLDAARAELARWRDIALVLARECRRVDPLEQLSAEQAALVADALAEGRPA